MDRRGFLARMTGGAMALAAGMTAVEQVEELIETSTISAGNHTIYHASSSNWPMNLQTLYSKLWEKKLAEHKGNMEPTLLFDPNRQQLHSAPGIDELIGPRR